jgi:cell division protein FtsB
MAASASTTSSARSRRASGPATGGRRRATPPGIRWDRIGRVALLCVLGLVLYLYIGPTRTWISTWRESKHRGAELQALRTENAKLRARRDDLRKASTLENEARALGMLRAGEKGYVVRGLPAN